MQEMGCLTSGSMILTSKGYKEIQSIQSIQSSDLVYTCNGNWKPIVIQEEKIYVGEVMHIKTLGSTTPISVTFEHPFLTKCIIGTGLGKDDFELSKKTSWTPASSIKVGKHVLCIPIEQANQPVNINIQIEDEQRTITKIDWFMVGYYVGKGKHVLDVDFIPPGWNILREFTSDPSAEIAICNHIPEWVQRLPIKDIDSFIRGFERSAKSIDVFIVMNEIVALHIQRLYAKLKRFVSIHIDTCIVILCPMRDHALFDDEYMYVPINSITNSRKEITVYNLQVADDNSYVVENLATR